MKILGLDVGEKRIGVAKADSSTRIAIPVGFIANDGSQWQEIGKYLRLYGTNWVVMGLPRSNEGNETEQSLYVRQFAKALTEKVPGVKIRFQDESLTSVEAEERLKARKKRYEKGEIDAEAASIILQDFLENLHNEDEEHFSPDTRRFAPASQGAFKGARPSLRSEEKVPHLPENVANVAKKTGDKAALNAKIVQDKAKKVGKKSKKAWKIALPIVILAIVAAAVGGALWYKDKLARERAEYYAALEAAMQADVFKFTILPGQTIYDVQKNLRTAVRTETPEKHTEEEMALLTGYPEAEITEAFNADYSAEFPFLKNRPAGATLEGYLYGETYEFYADATVADILKKFLTGMGQVIELNNLEAAYAEQGLTLHEGVTLASIVQKESPASEMPTVAQVFLTRLDYGISLGSDVTVAYALDTVDPDRTIYRDNQAALQIESCYNTRRYAGLPCGPISNPGLSALTAVAHPSDTTYLFFLTGDDGLMYYSYTEAEHNTNAYYHCQELCYKTL